MLWITLIALIVIVFLLGWAGIIETMIYPDKPRPPKVTLNRQENLRRGASHKQAVDEWKRWRRGELAESDRTYPERDYEQNFNFVDKLRGRTQ